MQEQISAIGLNVLMVLLLFLRDQHFLKKLKMEYKSLRSVVMVFGNGLTLDIKRNSLKVI
ncbi:hypothetical protein BHG40_00655 [Aeromonas salmonicida subsp. masoucida]|nr:hypothetical protein BHG40_00655 [Aeromonas salmonicida subsp. masoucida]